MFHTSEALSAVVAAALGASSFFIACGLQPGGVENDRGAHVIIAVAPLTAPAVTSARYTIVVTNEAGYTVWSRLVDSSDHGLAHGALEYVGPCDASEARHRVTLAVDALYVGPARRGEWLSPAVEQREVLCLPNQTVRADFDLAIRTQARADRAEAGETPRYIEN